MMKNILLGLFLTPTLSTAGGIFSIDNRQTGFATGPAAAQINASLSGLADNLEAQVNNLLSESSRSSLSDGGADANIGITLALNGDRTNIPDAWMLAVGAQATIQRPDAGGTTSAANRIPSVGVGAQGSIALSAKGSSIGIGSIGPLSGDRLLITASGMALSHESNNISVDFWNLGLNLRYQWIAPKSAPLLLSFNGVFVRTGLNYASTTAKYKSNIATSTSATAGGQNIDMSIALDYALGLKSSQFTIPLEASSSITILSFLSLYGGGSLDLSFGSTGLTGTGTGPVTAAASSDPAMKIFEGTANLNLDDADADRSPALGTLRAFAGVEFKLPYFRIGGEYTTMSTGAWGVAALGKFVF